MWLGRNEARKIVHSFFIVLTTDYFSRVNIRCAPISRLSSSCHTFLAVLCGIPWSTPAHMRVTWPLTFSLFLPPFIASVFCPSPEPPPHLPPPVCLFRPVIGSYAARLCSPPHVGFFYLPPLFCHGTLRNRIVCVSSCNFPRVLHNWQVINTRSCWFLPGPYWRAQPIEEWAFLYDWYPHRPLYSCVYVYFKRVGWSVDHVWHFKQARASWLGLRGNSPFFTFPPFFDNMLWHPTLQWSATDLRKSLHYGPPSPTHEDFNDHAPNCGFCNNYRFSLFFCLFYLLCISITGISDFVSTVTRHRYLLWCSFLIYLHIMSLCNHCILTDYLEQVWTLALYFTSR